MTSNKTYRYSAYGLRFHSEIQLTELMPAESGEDVVIKFENLNSEFLKSELTGCRKFERPGCTVYISAERTLCDWEGLAKVFVRNGCEVMVDPYEGVNDLDLAPLITGAILGNLLSQRGILVLHGSAVVANNEGIAFLGDKGAGKSTIVAHLQKRGHRFVTDDLIPIIFDNDEIKTIPGFPRVRLWPDSVRSIGLQPESLTRISSFIDKYSHGCLENYSDEPIRIRRLVILSVDGKINVNKLDPVESFIEIVRNTYMNRYLNALELTSLHFSQCEKIVKAIPVFNLQRPHDFETLDQVAELVENLN